MSFIEVALILTAATAGVVDTDGDGSPDAADAYPCDPAASAQIFAPSVGQHALLMFEDQWPARGDLDFNDVVLGWSVAMRADGAGRVSAVRLSLDVLALGGMLDHGLGLRLPVAPSALASATRSIDGGPAQALAPTGDPQLTVRISPNLRELFAGAAGQINSTSLDQRRQGQLVVVDIRFAQPVSIAAAAAPFDLFVFRSATPGHEIHRPDYGGTADMDAALFGTADDGSSGARRFVDTAGLPFAIVLPQVVDYPAEATEIAALYPRILAFASSGGTSAQDFYTTPVLAAAYADVNGAGVLAPRWLGDRVPDACNECPSGHCLAPSCTDGVINGGERLVDCGGQCALPETCNGLDDDCDGEIDDGNPGADIACGAAALGACAAGTTACDAGALACLQVVTPVAEACNGTDDDCDGTTDEGNPGGGVACTTGGLGACGPGLTACQAGAVRCVASVAATVESCNAIDDDCDGTTDEGGVCLTTDEFTGNTGLWTPDIAYGGSSWNATWGSGYMTLTCPNNWLVRMRSVNALDGNFEIRTSGRIYWSGSNLQTHIKGFVGLYHAGSTTNAALQFRVFFDNTVMWPSETRYGVDLNTLLGAASGATDTFNLHFVKTGNTVRIYTVSGTTETLRSTFTITNPAATLRWEFIHIDGTSSGNGNLQIDRWELTRTP